MKHMVGSHRISGYVKSLECIRTKRKEEVSAKTLGQLVGELTGSFLTTTGSDENGNPETGDPSEGPAEAHVSFRVRLEMTEEEYNSTKEGLAKLVTLRNELVHHFLQRYDLSDQSGANAANVYLDEVRQVIERQLDALRGWAKAYNDTREATKEFLDSPDAEMFLVYGVLPGHEIDWPGTKIVQQLRMAERNCGEGGWTNLKKAIDVIRTQWPELMPKLYSCSSWRQVIHESRLFETEKRTEHQSGDVQVWYRSKSTNN